MKLTLTRVSETDNATFGWLRVEDENYNTQYDLATLELPWHGNRRNVSCIPKGEYEVAPRRFGYYYNAYKAKNWQPQHEFSIWVKDVPQRDAILIHTGNIPKHTRGCILVGLRHTQVGVAASYNAYKSLYLSMAKAVAAGDKVSLVITDSELEDEPGRWVASEL